MIVGETVFFFPFINDINDTTVTTTGFFRTGPQVYLVLTSGQQKRNKRRAKQDVDDACM